MVDLERASAEIAETMTSIEARVERIAADNKRMRSLLAQAALFIACQPENRFRTKWLQEVQELCDG